MLLERFEEELEDACEYHKLSEQYELDHEDIAHGLWLIGREEATHARYLYHHIVEEIPEELREKWDKVKRIYHLN
jgi:hypothetical protein